MIHIKLVYHDSAVVSDKGVSFLMVFCYILKQQAGEKRKIIGRRQRSSSSRSTNINI